MSPAGSSASELLQRFAANRCGEAFRELVKRYSGFVMAVARRQTGGDVAAAEDIVQEVFCGLAGEVKKVRGDTLGAWLHRRTVFAAGHWRRGEQRRKRRESVAAQMPDNGAAPQTTLPEGFDEAFAKLRETDQQLLLWRYVEEWDYHTIGLRTGVSEDAAQKRAARALEQLRTALVKRGALKVTSALAPMMVAAAGRETVSAAQQAKWAGAAVQHARDVSWAGAGMALPAACLVAGVAVPVLTMRQGFAARTLEQPTAAETESRIVSTTAAAKRQDAPSDFYELLAMMKRAEKSPLWMARANRAVAGVGAAACRKMIESLGYEPDYSSVSHPGPLIELRKKLVAQWSEKDPAEAVQHLTATGEPQVAFHAMGARDIAAAERAVMTTPVPQSTDEASHRSSCWRAAVCGLAAKDLDAALAQLQTGKERLGLPHMDDLYTQICQEVVTSNPVAAAEMMARRGTHEYRAEALKNVSKLDARLAWAMLRASPVPAAQRREVESAIFNRLIKQDVRFALRMAEEILGEKAAVSAASGAAEVLLRSGFENALEEARSCRPGAFREVLIQSLKEQLVYKEPKEALTRFRADDPATSGLWWRALHALAGADPAAAAAIKFPAGAKDDDHLVPIIARGLEYINEEQARQWATGLPKSLRIGAEQALGQGRKTLSSDPAAQGEEVLARVETGGSAAELSNLMMTWFSQDPAAAASFADKLKAKSRIAAHAGIVAATRVRSPSQVAAAAGMVSDWAGGSEPLPETALSAAYDFADNWGREDAEAASTWVNSLPRGPVFDRAASALARSAAVTDPREALTWATAIGGEESRNNTAERVIQDWSAVDHDGAKEAVETLEAPAEVKAAFSKFIRPPHERL